MEGRKRTEETSSLRWLEHIIQGHVNQKKEFVFFCSKGNGKSRIGHNLFCEKKIVAEQEWKEKTRQETIVVILASNSCGLDRVDVGRQKYMVGFGLLEELP